MYPRRSDLYGRPLRVRQEAFSTRYYSCIYAYEHEHRPLLNDHNCVSCEIRQLQGGDGLSSLEGPKPLRLIRGTAKKPMRKKTRRHSLSRGVPHERN